MILSTIVRNLDQNNYKASPSPPGLWNTSGDDDDEDAGLQDGDVQSHLAPLPPLPPTDDYNGYDEDAELEKGDDQISPV
jgi:hypothetical protein